MYSTPQSYDKKIQEVVDFYASIAFKQNNDSEMGTRTPGEYWRSKWPLPPNPENPSTDVLILSDFFSSEVWCCDVECDVCPKNERYVDLLSELSQISHGAFTPSDIKESWRTEAGPTTIRFRLNGEMQELHPEYYDDCLDLDIIEDINKLISSSGRSFDFDACSQQGWMMCITPAQKESMIQIRNYPFAERSFDLMELLQKTPLYVYEAQSWK